MTNTLRMGATGVALMTVLVGGPRASAAQGTDRRLVVAVQNYARLPASSLARIQKEATDIYAAAGVSVTWISGRAASAEFEGVHRVTVLLLSPEMGARKIGSEHIGGTVLAQAARAAGRAYIFVDRVVATAAKHRLDGDLLLGKVIAHELGHLVLPVNSHSERGIMRVDMDLRRRVQRFTPDQSATMGAILLAGGRLGE